MTDLPSLIERVEKASGPDRRLDAKIGAATRQMPQSDPDAWVSGWPHAFIAAPQFKGSIGAPNSKGDLVCHWEALPYTASLDAAMSLVPEGWGRIEFGTFEHHPGFWVSLMAANRRIIESEGATPALALLAAALRARKDR